MIDTRVVVEPTSGNPFSWIREVEAEFRYGEHKWKSNGTAFLIRFPGANCQLLLTAAHVLCDNFTKDLPKVKTSGGQLTYRENGILTSSSFTSDDVWFPEDFYTTSAIRKFDYAIIRLPYNRDNIGFGLLSTRLSLLVSEQVITAGFPGDKPKETLCTSGGKIINYDHEAPTFHTSFKLFGGQSGSPIWSWYQGYTAIGIAQSVNQEDDSSRGRQICLNVIKDILRFNGKKEGVSISPTLSPTKKLIYDDHGEVTISTNFKPENSQLHLLPIATISSNYFVEDWNIEPQAYFISAVRKPELILRVNEMGIYHIDMENISADNQYFPENPSSNCFYLKSMGNSRYTLMSDLGPNLFLSFEDEELTLKQTSNPSDHELFILNGV
ncbi:hypothetical protein D3C87_741880 [compost metagenome]